MAKHTYTWTMYPVGTLLKVKDNRYVLRVAKSVSDLEPRAEKVFSDKLLTVTAWYNKRGYCVGYSLEYKDKPAILHDNFYLLLDYVGDGEKPKEMTIPQLKGKLDSSVCLVKFGTLWKNRMYVFIYRRKQDG